MMAVIMTGDLVLTIGPGTGPGTVDRMSGSPDMTVIMTSDLVLMIGPGTGPGTVDRMSGSPDNGRNNDQ